MPITTSSKPKRRQGIDSQPLPDGSGLLFDSETGTAYPITESAMLIWEQCDGEHPVAAILDELETRYEIDRATLEADSLKLLEDFAEKSLLEASPAAA